MKQSPPLARAVALASALVVPLLGLASAHAEGVSPSRLSLPSGPGSLEGIGENAQPNINMGLVSYSVPLAVPAGHAGLSPSLSLSYSSSGGSSLVGMGWSFGGSSIERMTSEGLPRYGPDDQIAADGGSELVRLPGTDTFRARFEGGFTRYRWIDPTGAGRDGYWTAEYPDGRVGYFGARASGQPVLEARVSGAEGTFRWHLVELVDPLGHTLRHHYSKDGNTSRLDRITYAFDALGVPHYQIVLGYEARPDHLVDFKPGFEVRQTTRLAAIEVYVGPVLRRRYQLFYQLPEIAGGLSRLATVHHYGVGGVGPHPVQLQFDYSDHWYPGCDDDACRQPVIRTLGSVGVDFRTGAADLVDMNGDGLPDVVDTTGGAHTIHINEITPGGTHRFRAPYTSERAQGGSANLSSPLVQMFDLNGDGFMDLIDGANSLFYVNRGTGDWSEVAPIDIGLPDFASDADLRFFDWDNDKHIDVLHADRTSTWVFENKGDGTYATTETFTDDALGVGFTSDGIQLADMNGDGLQDVVRVLDLVAAYRPNLGYGRFGAWIEMTDLPPVLANEIQLVDVNGDSLSDALVILGNEVRYALNRNGLYFDPIVVVAQALGGSIPERTSEISVRLADMNGNGSTDVVWIDASGRVTYLELEPIRPNLLTRVRNGIGKVIEMRYASSVEHMSRDGGPGAWARRLPQPHQVLEELTHYDSLNGLRETKTFLYHDGYYDGEEKQFRGFENVEVVTTGDTTIESGLTSHHFDVGVTDRYRHGLGLRQEVFSAGRPIEVTESTYADCPVAEVPQALEPPVRHVCQTASVRKVREGGPQSGVVTIREEMQYDGYGNQTRSAKLGVVAIGGGGCAPCDRDPDAFGAPCGAQCLGDESYTETSFVPPTATSGRWMLRMPYREKRFASPTSDLFGETLTYYDGAPFEGLSLGTASRGLAVRKSMRVATGVYVSRERIRYDAHGNVVEQRDGNDRTRVFGYDPHGLYAVSERILFDDPSRAEPYSIMMHVELDPVHERITRSFRWYIPEETKLANRYATDYTYDDFGRQLTTHSPLDPSGAATASYSYDLGDPVSRIVTRMRSRVGGPLDLESINCIDGNGRLYQTRTRVGDGYEVSEYQIYDSQGKNHRNFGTFKSPDARCDQVAPSGLVATDVRRDAKGRHLERRAGDAPVFGTASVTRNEYGPLWSAELSPAATDASDPRFGIRTVTTYDGLTRPVRYSEDKDGAALWWIDIEYDALGNVRGFRDAKGNTSRQDFDALSRMVRQDDPTSGVTTFEYDAADNLVAQTRADGVTMRFAHDEANRLVAQWDDAHPEATRIDHLYDRPVDCLLTVCTHVVGERAAVRYPAEITEGEPEIATEVMGYDVVGRPVYNAITIGRRRYESRFDIDLAGRLSRLTLPGGSTLDYIHDARSRLVAIPGYVPEVRYDIAGLIKSVRLGNGVVTTYTHDVTDALVAFETVAPDGTVLQDYEIARDRVANLIAIHDSAAREGVPSANGTFGYDLRGRLTSAIFDGDRAGLSEELSFDYDILDNMLSKTSSRASSPENVGALEYGVGSGGPYAVTRAGDVTYTYNEAGLMLRRGQDSYTWDFMGRLVGVARGTERRARFVYGEGEERVAKIEGGRVSIFLGSDIEIRDGIATAWLSVGNQRVAKIERAGFAAAILGDLAPLGSDGTNFEVTPDGEVTAADALVAARARAGLLDLDAALDAAPPNELLSASSHRLLVGPRERVTYAHANPLGSIVLTTDESAREVLRTEFYPHGETRYTSRGYLEDYSYRGKERDESSGLTYFGARYLDPRIGRWTSPDLHYASPTASDLRTPESTNRYLYALNSPMSYKDSDGRASQNNFNRNGNSGGFSSASVQANYNHMLGFAWRVRTRERGSYQKRTTISSLSMSLPGGGTTTKPDKAPASATQRVERESWKLPTKGPGGMIADAISNSVSSGTSMSIKIVSNTYDNKDTAAAVFGGRAKDPTPQAEAARVTLFAKACGLQGAAMAMSKIDPNAQLKGDNFIYIKPNVGSKSSGGEGSMDATYQVNGGPCDDCLKIKIENEPKAREKQIESIAGKAKDAYETSTKKGASDVSDQNSKLEGEVR